MRILLVNNHHYLLGGAEKYYLILGKLLESKGNKVAYFSTLNPNNVNTKWQKYFIKDIDTKGYSVRNLINVLKGSFYSPEAKNNISRLLDDFKPDIVHLNNIYYRISPSIIFEVKKRGIPIVETVHDYHLISPNVNLFHNAKICEISKGGKFYRTFFHKCVKDSYLISGLTALSYYFHNLTGVYGKIDRFITPSNFLKDKLVEYGMDGKRITTLPNFVNKDSVNKYKPGYYVLFFGVMLKHKGVYELIEAARELPGIPFVFAGDGPEFTNIKRSLKEKKIKNIKLTGRLKGYRLNSVIQNSRFVVVPSLWYENMPYSIIESFAFGKPVVASDIGGIPEMIRDGYNGMLVNPENIKSLTKKIGQLFNDKKSVNKMSINALKTVKEKYLQEKHYRELIKIYKNLIK